VALVVAFPKQVTMFLDAPIQYDLKNIEIDVPAVGGEAPAFTVPEKSADPLQDLLNRQQKEEESANDDLMKQFKK
jgi:hypothetical protein